MKPGTAEALHAGRELFNAEKPFEAHEVWEVAWRTEDGETRTLLQALILVAGGWHKAKLNEPVGTKKLLTAAATKLSQLRPDEAGFDIKQLLQSVSRVLAEGGPVSFRLESGPP
jgi:hypothetical protein